ncbi:MAG TPA: NIPSNAP family protein [Verrucomicrobiae bacterium]|jgi:hypothetical protein
MKRRDFLKTSLAASAFATLAPSTASVAAEKGLANREYYEWRAYRLKAGADSALLHGYWEKAAIPALNRLGSKPIGVFTEIEPKEDPAVFVLIPHASLEAFAASAGKLHSDEEHLKAGAEYLQVAKKNPAFARIDSWLLHAFAGMPKIELPAYCRERKPRIFEARTYESHSEVKAQKKVDMFNAGEVDVMRDVGLGPIFFGQALVGNNLPHLTYLLSAETRELHKEHFAGFGKDPRWKKLAADQQYADTVSKSTSKFLQPTAYSQI